MTNILQPCVSLTTAYIEYEMGFPHSTANEVERYPHVTKRAIDMIKHPMDDFLNKGREEMTNGK